MQPIDFLLLQTVTGLLRNLSHIIDAKASENATHLVRSMESICIPLWKIWYIEELGAGVSSFAT